MLASQGLSGMPVTVAYPLFRATLLKEREDAGILDGTF
jgi:hypothetical protein